MITIPFKACFLSVAILLFLESGTFSQTGKDGAKTISSSGVIFNRYGKLTLTANSGDFSITVSNIADLSGSAISGAANNPYATDNLTTGDLLMIIKMQGAAINSANSTSYGAVTAYNNTGVYELVAVQSISGNTIILSAALANSFVVSGTQRVQVVRIPRLSSLTINSGASLTGQAWGSSYTGGIVAVEVTGNAVVNGTINTNSIGFRGGVVDANSIFPGVSVFVGTNSNDGAEKGESIAGYQTDYDILGGRYCKGAPANAGGGGTAHNAGGGGGANGGNPATWDGKGNPDISGANWNLAWDLEGGNFSNHTSSGGGRGGYSFHNRNRDALTVAPGNSLWNGDDRRIEGGLGGRPLTYANNTLFMGGGGGAGDQNDGSGTAGGNGGGIIYLSITGTLSGSGSITANGATATNATGIDACGGGGGGGAIKLNVLGSISGISLSATGGNGGSQIRSIITDEAEGPGGGGSGGYIAVTGAPSITINYAGGNNGITNSSGVTEFTPDGATKAGSGSGSVNISYESPPPQVFLPLTFISFDFQPLEGNKLSVKWAVAREDNTVKYDLEQSAVNGIWTVITSEIAKNEISTTKQYSLTIDKPLQTVYLRLKIIAKDGSYKYSEVKIFKVNENTFSIKDNGQFIKVSQIGVGMKVKLINNFGQEVKSAPKQNAGFVIIDKAQLTKGIYYLVIISADVKKTYEFIGQKE
jgi:hypothetical protein